jgi:RHS repeat-associated protein
MSTRPPLYFDNQATTPLDPRVLDAMMPALRDDYGNASSRFHAYGMKARNMVDDARAKVAALVGAQPDEIVFTSGATEADNLALRGVVRANAAKGKHVVAATTEHKAIVDDQTSSSNGPKRRYYYFGLAPLAERKGTWGGSSYSWSNDVYNTLAPGDLGQVVIRRTDVSGSPVDKFLHYDHIGNVLSETTTAGAVSVTHEYDAYGRPVLSSAAGWAGNSLHITTKPYDAETGLFYFWQRWYDPQTGLFLSEAPMGRDAEHPYGFVENGPLANSDPMGEHIGSFFACYIIYQAELGVAWTHYNTESNYNLGYMLNGLYNAATYYSTCSAAAQSTFTACGTSIWCRDQYNRNIATCLVTSGNIVNDAIGAWRHKQEQLDKDYAEAKARAKARYDRCRRRGAHTLLDPIPSPAAGPTGGIRTPTPPFLPPANPHPTPPWNPDIA